MNRYLKLHIFIFVLLHQTIQVLSQNSLVNTVVRLLYGVFPRNHQVLLKIRQSALLQYL